MVVRLSALRAGRALFSKSILCTPFCYRLSRNPRAILQAEELGKLKISNDFILIRTLRTFVILVTVNILQIETPRRKETWTQRRVVPIETNVSEEYITFIFRVEYQPSKKPVCYTEARHNHQFHLYFIFIYLLSPCRHREHTVHLLRGKTRLSCEGRQFAPPLLTSPLLLNIASRVTKTAGLMG
jgi:hypothetical protein